MLPFPSWYAPQDATPPPPPVCLIPGRNGCIPHLILSSSRRPSPSPRLLFLTPSPTDIVTTFTYQASIQGFAAAGVDGPRAAQLLNLAVDLAHQARTAFLEEQQQQQQEGQEAGPGQGGQDVGEGGSNALMAAGHDVPCGTLATWGGTTSVAGLGDWGRAVQDTEGQEHVAQAHV